MEKVSHHKSNKKLWILFILSLLIALLPWLLLS